MAGWGHITDIKKDGTAVCSYDDGTSVVGKLRVRPGGGCIFEQHQVWHEQVDPLPAPDGVKQIVVGVPADSIAKPE